MFFKNPECYTNKIKNEPYNKAPNFMTQFEALIQLIIIITNYNLKENINWKRKGQNVGRLR